MTIIEVNAITDIERRRKILAMLPSNRDIMPLSDLLFTRTANLQLWGFRPADSVHIAAAEMHGCDVLLTCDDRLINVWRRNRTKIQVRIANPVQWMNEHDKI